MGLGKPSEHSGGNQARAFAADRSANERAGFGHAVRRGDSPAVVVVDFSRGFTDPALPTGADMDAAVEATVELLATARRAGVPVVFTTIAYRPDEVGEVAWLEKAQGMASLLEGTAAVEVDPRLEPRPDEELVVKKGASAFFGTDLADLLRSRGADTVAICGATTSGCVRASAVDSVQSGFPTLVVRECVADRAPAAHEASLFDLQSKYADVVSSDDACSYLSSVSGAARS